MGGNYGHSLVACGKGYQKCVGRTRTTPRLQTNLSHLVQLNLDKILLESTDPLLLVWNPAKLYQLQFLLVELRSTTTSLEHDLLNRKLCEHNIILRREDDESVHVALDPKQTLQIISPWKRTQSSLSSHQNVHEPVIPTFPPRLSGEWVTVFSEHSNKREQTHPYHGILHHHRDIKSLFCSVDKPSPQISYSHRITRTNPIKIQQRDMETPK